MAENHDRGLYQKFAPIRRTDGKSEPGEKHFNCAYFVLDLSHDPHAIPAIAAYAESCHVDFPQLAADLRRIALYRPAQPTVPPSVALGHAIHDAHEEWDGSVERHPEDLAAAILALLGGRTEADARADMLDHLIDRFYAADKNHFALPYSVIDWLRHQPEYQARYGTDAAQTGVDHG